MNLYNKNLEDKKVTPVKRAEFFATVASTSPPWPCLPQHIVYPWATVARCPPHMTPCSWLCQFVKRSRLHSVYCDYSVSVHRILVCLTNKLCLVDLTDRRLYRHQYMRWKLSFPFLEAVDDVTTLFVWWALKRLMQHCDVRNDGCC